MYNLFHQFQRLLSLFTHIRGPSCFISKYSSTLGIALVYIFIFVFSLDYRIWSLIVALYSPADNFPVIIQQHLLLTKYMVIQFIFTPHFSWVSTRFLNVQECHLYHISPLHTYFIIHKSFAQLEKLEN